MKIRLETKKVHWKHRNEIGNKKRRLETKQVDWKQKRTLETLF